MLIEKGQLGESYNIGSSNEWSNIDLVKRICAILDDLNPLQSYKHEDLIEFVDDRPGHDLRYAIDSNKINKNLGWKSQTPFDRALSSTVGWYLDHWKNID